MGTSWQPAVQRGTGSRRRLCRVVRLAATILPSSPTTFPSPPPLVQIAVFLIPVVVLAGWAMGRDFTLDFDAFAVLMLTGVVRRLAAAADGRCRCEGGARRRHRDSTSRPLCLAHFTANRHAPRSSAPLPLPPCSVRHPGLHGRVGRHLQLAAGPAAGRHVLPGGWLLPAGFPRSPAPLRCACACARSAPMETPTDRIFFNSRSAPPLRSSTLLTAGCVGVPAAARASPPRPAVAQTPPPGSAPSPPCIPPSVPCAFLLQVAFVFLLEHEPANVALDRWGRK